MKLMARSPRSAEVKTEYSCTSSSCVCLYCMHPDNTTFTVTFISTPSPCFMP